MKPFNGKDKGGSNASRSQYNIADAKGKSLLTASDNDDFTAVEMEVFEVL